MAGKPFLKKSLFDTLGVKKFDEITLSCTVSEINVFLHFTQKFKMTAKSSRKQFVRMSPVYSADTQWVKNFVEIALSRTVSEIHAFCRKNPRWLPKWQDNDFLEKSPVDSAHTLWVKNFVEIALSCR